MVVGVRRYYTASRHWYCPRMRIFHVSPQGGSLVHSSRVANIGRSDPFRYFIMYPEARCPFSSSLEVANGSGEVPVSGA